MSWMNLLILLVLSAGHAELLVTMVNRLHSLPIGCSRLRHLRHLHDVLIPVFPVVLVWFVGIQGPGLLFGGNWTDLPAGWQIYLAICALGFCGLVYAVVRWNLRHRSKVRISRRSHFVDLAQRLGEPPVGDGPLHFLTSVPGNEAFRVEVAEKEFRLPGLPAAWDGLSILHVSDLHLIDTLKRRFFEEVAELAAGQPCDLVVFTGDLLDDNRVLDWVNSTLGRLDAPLGRYFILGNHDWYLDQAAIRKRMSDLGWQDVGSRALSFEHHGHSLAIGGTERPWIGRHPDFSTTPAKAFRILLSHTPDHIGWARRNQVDLMLSGHNHGGQVILPVVGPVYSPSRFGVKFACGDFWHEPTLLYVSRGISGRHPLRWNCPPELTRLVLRSPVTADDEMRGRQRLERSTAVV